ncbi:MAG: SPOR domain-containing protein [Desulfosoma sp.]
MQKKKIFVPKARTQNNKGGMPKALLGRIFMALSIGIVFVLVLALVWKQKAQPPIGDDGDAGKPKLYREIPKMTVPEPQVLSLDKAGPAPPKDTDPSGGTPAPQGQGEGQGSAGLAPGASAGGGTEAARTPGTETKNPASSAASKASGTPAPSGTQTTAAAKAGSQPAAPPSAKTEKSPVQLTSTPQKPSAAADASGSWAYAVQVGAYSQKENAQQAVERLKKFGFQPEITPFRHPKLGALYAVRVAPFASQAEAQKAAEKISASEKDKPIIVKVPQSR